MDKGNVWFEGRWRHLLHSQWSALVAIQRGSPTCRSFVNTLELVLSLWGMRHGESQELRPQLGTCHSLLTPSFRGAGVSPRAEAGGVPGEEGGGETGVKGKEDLANRSGPLSGSGSEIPVVSKHYDLSHCNQRGWLRFLGAGPCSHSRAWSARLWIASTPISKLGLLLQEIACGEIRSAHELN